jgi:hypothetical protein
MKAASLNCVLFMTFSLGTAFPFFYIIGLFGIVIQYIVERYTLALFYRLPSKFSLHLTASNVFALAVAALFNAAFTFWMMGNTRMFKKGQAETLDYVEEIPASQHTLGPVFLAVLSMSLSVPELIGLVCTLVCLFALIIVFLVKLIRFRSRDHAFMTSKESTAPSYLEAIKEGDLEELIEEEKTYVYDLNTQNISEKNLHKADDILVSLRNGKKKRRVALSGEPYYQIYKNFDYWLKFNSKYSFEERNIKLLLNLPLISPTQHANVILISHRLRRLEQDQVKKEEKNNEEMQLK